MDEIVITSGKLNHLIDPTLHIWGWEIPVYLFLGGLVAGIVALSAIVVLLGKEKQMRVAASKIPVLAPILLSIGMLALFLDLEHKLRVYQLYLTFQPTSPMSWGSWILILFYPFNLFFIVIQLKNGFPKFYNEFLLKRIPQFDKIADFLVGFTKPITYINLILGIAIGIYTGILLGTFSARPFWNSAILGPLFLVSGLSAAAALIVLFSKEREEIKLFQKVDLGFIVVELLFLALLIIELATGPEITKQAVHLIMGGELTAFFWIFVMGIGLIIPALLEVYEINGRHIPAALSPTLVLIGGLLLRFLMVEAGQMSTWIPY